MQQDVVQTEPAFFILLSREVTEEKWRKNSLKMEAISPKFHPEPEGNFITKLQLQGLDHTGNSRWPMGSVL